MLTLLNSISYISKHAYFLMVFYVFFQVGEKEEHEQKNERKLD